MKKDPGYKDAIEEIEAIVEEIPRLTHPFSSDHGS